jgi:MucB/RseB family protein
MSRAQRSVALALVGAAVAVLAPAAADADDPVEDARRAAETTAYTGRVTVHWVDEAGEHRAGLDVRGGGGAMLLDGPAVLMARGGERLVRGPTGAWDRLWSSGLRPQPGPSPTAKYEIVEGPGPIVAGRPTTVLELRYRGELRERLFLDDATHLVLRREQFDERGRLRRAVAFDKVDVGKGLASGSGPRNLRHLEPRVAEAAQLERPFRAPERLAGGYRRIGTYRRNGTVQVLYHDGLYGLSLFQQAGRVDRDGLPPAGRMVAVGVVTGWHWTWAGGDILLWPSGDAVYTAVSDAPFDELVAAAASITPGSREASALEKLRRACRSLLRMFD